MSRIEQDVLRIYDDDPYDNVIMISAQEDQELDEAESVAVVIWKSNGDGAILGLRFDHHGVHGILRTYADGEPSHGPAISTAYRL